MWHAHTYTQSYTRTQTHKHGHTYARARAHTHTCTHIRIRTCTHALFHTHAHTHTRHSTHNTLQHTATHCNTLQRTATHCNILLLHTAERISMFADSLTLRIWGKRNQLISGKSRKEGRWGRDWLAQINYVKVRGITKMTSMAGVYYNDLSCCFVIISVADYWPLDCSWYVAFRDRHSIF